MKFKRDRNVQRKRKFIIGNEYDFLETNLAINCKLLKQNSLVCV